MVTASTAVQRYNAKLTALGLNHSGQLGNGSYRDASVPVAVLLPVGVDAVSVSAGGHHSLAIGSDGNLYAWGDNVFGQLGSGDNRSTHTPATVELPAGAIATAVSAGGYHSLAIGSDGNLYAWGDNVFGQLGSGDNRSTHTPVTVELPAGTTPTAVSGGFLFSLAIGSDGNLYAWGDNRSGQLGSGDNRSTHTPVTVELPAGVIATAVAAGGYHSLAIGSDGNLYAWGDNVFGQLGRSNTDTRTPVAVLLPAGVTAAAVAAGGFHSLAIGSDGNLYAWGDNVFGQLGRSNTDTRTPVAVLLPAGVTALAVSGAGYHSLATIRATTTGSAPPALRSGAHRATMPG